MTVEESRRIVDMGDDPKEDWWELAERVREQIARRRGGRPLPDNTDLIHEMREERDRQLMEAVGFPLDPREPSCSSS